MFDVMERLRRLVESGNLEEVESTTREALAQGISAKEVLNQALLPAMDRVGLLFGEGNLYIPEVIRSAQAMHVSLDVLHPMFEEAEVKMTGEVVIGTVAGDLHDIGKNLVRLMLEGAGFEVVDLGVDIKPEEFVGAVQKHRPQVLCLSALLTTTMRNMEGTVDAIHRAGLRDSVRIIVGGAPVTREFALEIGADDYGADASEAVRKVKALVESSKA